MDDIGFFEEHSGEEVLSPQRKKKVHKALVGVALEEGVKIQQLTYIVIGDEELRQMNIQFLQHDYYTDVITFDLSDGENVTGEVYVSIDRIKENSREYEVSEIQELCRVFFHGLLHLIGYGDKNFDEQKKMREKEDYYLNKYSSTWNSSKDNV